MASPTPSSHHPPSFSPEHAGPPPHPNTPARLLTRTRRPASSPEHAGPPPHPNTPARLLTRTRRPASSPEHAGPPSVAARGGRPSSAARGGPTLLGRTRRSHPPRPHAAVPPSSAAHGGPTLLGRTRRSHPPRPHAAVPPSSAAASCVLGPLSEPPTIPAHTPVSGRRGTGRLASDDGVCASFGSEQGASMAVQWLSAGLRFCCVVFSETSGRPRSGRGSSSQQARGSVR